MFYVPYWHVPIMCMSHLFLKSYVVHDTCYNEHRCLNVRHTYKENGKQN